MAAVEETKELAYGNVNPQLLTASLLRHLAPSSPMTDKLTHVAESGEARMVDVSAKPESERLARATGSIRMRPETLLAIVNAEVKKGDVLGVARIAGVMAAKRTVRPDPPLPPAGADRRSGEPDAGRIAARRRRRGHREDDRTHGRRDGGADRSVGRAPDGVRHGEGARPRDGDLRYIVGRKVRWSSRRFFKTGWHGHCHVSWGRRYWVVLKLNCCHLKTYAQPTWDVRPPGGRGAAAEADPAKPLCSRFDRFDGHCLSEPEAPHGERRTCGIRILVVFFHGDSRKLRHELETTQGELSLVRAQFERADKIIQFSTRFGVTADMAGKVFDASVREGLDPELAFRLVRLESDFNEHAISKVGAIGLSQVMPSTARVLDKSVTREALFNGKTNLRVGFKYLRGLLRMFKGNVNLALLAYNRGEDAVWRDVKAGVNPGNGYDRWVMRDYKGKERSTSRRHRR